MHTGTDDDRTSCNIDHCLHEWISLWIHAIRESGEFSYGNRILEFFHAMKYIFFQEFCKKFDRGG